jgi:hypothetical protein
MPPEFSLKPTLQKLKGSDRKVVVQYSGDPPRPPNNNVRNFPTGHLRRKVRVDVIKHIAEAVIARQPFRLGHGAPSWWPNATLTGPAATPVTHTDGR